MPFREAAIDSSSHIASAAVTDARAATRAARCATMLAHPTAAVAIVESGRIRAVNAHWRSLFALAAEASLDESTTVALFASVQVAERFDRAVADRLTRSPDAASAHATFEHPLVRVDGTGFLGELLVWPLEPSPGSRPTAGDAVWEVCDVTGERALRAEMRDLEGYYRALQRHQRDLSFVIDRKGRVSYASPSVAVALGYREGSLLGRNFTTLLDPRQRSDVESWFRRRAMRVTGDEPQADAEDYRLHVVAKDGSRRILACHPHDCFDVPRLSGLVLHARDVTAERDVALQRAAADATHDMLRRRLAGFAASGPRRGDDRVAALLEALFTDLGVTKVVWSTSDETEGPRVVACHSAANGFESLGAAKAPPTDHVGFVHFIDRTPPAVHAVEDIAVNPSTHARRALFETADIAAFIDVPVSVDGRICGFLTVGAPAARAWTRAETEYVTAFATLLAHAHGGAGGDAAGSLDALTSLIGRVEADRRLAALVADRTSHPALLVLVVNLDRMRDLNDRHGHEAGDRVIAEAGRRLATQVQAPGFVARVGGDEFLVVLEEADLTRSVALGEALLEVLAAASPDTTIARVKASIGAGRLALDSPDGESLWQKADLAMREAKQRGRGQAVFFQARFGASMAARAELGAEIEEALANDEFALFYQPQISLASGKLVGLEALLRWHHPTRGLLLPGLFLEAAIEGGLIDAVTKVVFGQVCDQLVQWRRLDGFPEIPVSVNVSAQQFHDRRLPALVAAALLRTGLPARLLVLEVTEEHLVVDSAATERVVKELALLGVRIAIGSFGLNHASLRSLHQLRVSQIKLDRGFVEGLPDDREGALVLEAAIEIGRRLKFQVIAEGVETAAQYESLREMHCEAGQGFHFGAPLSADELQSFVEARQVPAVS